MFPAGGVGQRLSLGVAGTLSGALWWWEPVGALTWNPGTQVLNLWAAEPLAQVLLSV